MYMSRRDDCIYTGLIAQTRIIMISVHIKKICAT